MSLYEVYVNAPDTARPSEVADLSAYLESVEFTGSTPPPTVSASMTLSGRLVGLSLPDAVFESEEEISAKATALLEQMRQTARRTAIEFLREKEAAE